MAKIRPKNNKSDAHCGKSSSKGVEQGGPNAGPRNIEARRCGAQKGGGWGGGGGGEEGRRPVEFRLCSRVFFWMQASPNVCVVLLLFVLFLMLFSSIGFCCAAVCAICFCVCDFSVSFFMLFSYFRLFMSVFCLCLVLFLLLYVVCLVSSAAVWIAVVEKITCLF